VGMFGSQGNLGCGNLEIGSGRQEKRELELLQPIKY